MSSIEKSFLLFLLCFLTSRSLHGGEKYTVGELDAPLTLAKNISSVLPLFTRDNGIEKEVRLAFTVDRKGRVASVKILDTNSSEYAEWAARQKKRMRFKPPTVDGKGVEVVAYEHMMLFLPGDSVPEVGPHELDHPLKAVYRPKLDYPRSLDIEEIEGRVRLKVLVTRDGKVEVREVVAASHPGFVVPAIRAAESTYYLEPTVNGKPCEVAIEMGFAFKI